MAAAANAATKARRPPSPKNPSGTGWWGPRPDKPAAAGAKPKPTGQRQRKTTGRASSTPSALAGKTGKSKPVGRGGKPAPRR